MYHLLAILVLSSGFVLSALPAAERTITISNHETTTWQCVPAGTTDTSSAVTRFSGLDVGTAHRLIPIGPGNNPPIAQDLDATVDEDGSVVIDLIATDPDGDPLTFLVAGQPEHGLASVDGAQITYVPTADYHGSDDFTYRAFDGTDYGNEATITISVTPVQDAPTAAFTWSGSGLELSVDAAGSNDIDGDELDTYAWDWGDGSSDPASSAATASHTYAANGVYTVTLTVTDEYGASANVSQQVSVSDGTGNTAPVANDLTVTTTEGDNVAFVLTGSDPDGDELTFKLQIPFGDAHGSFAGDVSKDGSGDDWKRYTYRPDADFAGTFTITFTVSDGTHTSDPATVTIIVEAINDAPVAAFSHESDGMTVLMDASGSSDPEGDRLVQFAWDWGDGTSTVVDAPTASHTYAAGGSYLVTLSVTDEYGATGSVQGQVVPISDGSNLTGHGGLSMRALSGGSFLMGEDDVGDWFDFGYEDPEHTVTLSPFAISVYEVTNAQCVALMNWAIDQGLASVTSTAVEHDGTVLLVLDQKGKGDERNMQISWNGSELVADGEGWLLEGDDVNDHPTGQMTWYGALAYCAFLNQREELEQAVDLETWSIDTTLNGYRLPTEAEWEFAARGGLEQKIYPWGDELDGTLANYHLSAAPYEISRKSPVGYYPPNGYGLYDVAGNQNEWCVDWFAADYYASSPEHDPLGPDSGTTRVIRSGAFNVSDVAVRCSARPSSPPTDIGGFRPVRSQPPGANQ